MGEIRKYTCSCGYQKDLFVGAGLQGINISAIERFFSEDIVQPFKEQRSRDEVQSYLLENAIISCSGCKELFTVPFFHYELTDGEQKCYITPCPVCQKPGDVITSANKVPCPKCGCQMEFEATGHWD